MAAVFASAFAAPTSVLQPDVTKMQESATCDADDESLFMPFLSTGVANPSVTTPYGYSKESGCSCRYCNDVLPDALHQASALVGPSEAVSPCITTQPQILKMGRVLGSEDNLDTICQGDITDTESLMLEAMTSCLTPDRSAEGGLPPKTVYVMGDSKAYNLRHSVALAVKGEYQVRGYGIDSIGLLPGYDSHHLAKTNQAEIEKWQRVVDHAWTTVRTTMQPGDVVMMVHRHGSETVQDPPFMGTDALPMTISNYLDKTIITDTVEANGGRCVVVCSDCGTSDRNGLRRTSASLSCLQVRFLPRLEPAAAKRDGRRQGVLQGGDCQSLPARQAHGD